MTPIRFYFDFTSTFSYIAIHRIDDLAARYGRTVDWSAVSLGHLFHAQGVVSPPEVPKKFAYLKIDFPRSCAFAGLPCVFPAPFPPDVKLARLAFWRLKARDPVLARTFAKAVSLAVFGHGKSVAGPDDLAAACAAACPGVAGLLAEDLAAVGSDSVAKQAVIAALEAAVADGMIGAPFMVLDGEPFWGADRLDQLERRLSKT